MPKATPNVVNFGRLWQDLNLDILILSPYAPGHSRHNPVERSWARLSKWLRGVTLLIALEGKPLAWEHFTGLSESEIHKEKLRFWMRHATSAANTGMVGK